MEQNTEQIQDNYAIRIDDLHKSYGNSHIIKGIDLSIPYGKVFGFIGRNGTGKSTTISCMVGLRDFEKGDIKICSHSIKSEPLKAKALFGFVPSEPIAYDNMTGREYLSFIAGAYGMTQKDYIANARILCERFEFTKSDLARQISEYSLGMRQKIGLMASLIHNPMVWILDEPTVGLDPHVYDVLVEMIVQMKLHGRCVFITSHSIEFVSQVADQVAILKDGVIQMQIDFIKEPQKRAQLRPIFNKISHMGGPIDLEGYFTHDN